MDTQCTFFSFYRPFFIFEDFETNQFFQFCQETKQNYYRIMTSATKLNEDTPLLSSKLRSMDWDDAKTPAKKVAHWYIIPPIFAVTFTIG